MNSEDPTAQRPYEETPFDVAEFANNPEPRCPCILLVDTSGSMAQVTTTEDVIDTGRQVRVDGNTYREVVGGVRRIDALNNGLRTFREELIKDELAAKRVEVAIVAFGPDARIVTEFTTPDAFTPPTLEPDGFTPLGGALSKALDLIEERKQAYRTAGIAYYRPWVFLITDGEPTDSWRAAKTRMNAAVEKRQLMFYVVGVEDDVNTKMLREIAAPQDPVKLKGLDFAGMFSWLSRSLQSVSRSQVGDSVPLENPAAPKGWATVV